MNISDNPLKRVRKLRVAGDLVGARAALESMDLEKDDVLAFYHILVLDELDEQAAKQAAIVKLIDNLSSNQSDTILALLIRQSERVCLPMSMTEKVLALAAGREAGSPELTLVCNGTRRRHAFRRRLAPEKQGVQLISLGGICLPWTLPNRWGFRDARQFIDDFNPFCLAFHLLPAILSALRNDFRAYLDSSTIAVEVEDHKSMFVRRSGSVQWRHNHGPYWTQEGFARLETNLLEKIENFRRSCRVNAPIVFLMAGFSPTPDQLLKLKIVTSRAANRNNSVLILSNHEHDIEAHAPTWIDDSIIRFHQPIPAADYRWFTMSTANSPAGLEFEEAYAATLLSCLSQVSERTG